MQRAVRGPGRVPVRRPTGRRPARRPAQQRALRPFDGRTAVFVAGSPTLHQFIASRLSSRTDIWVAKPLSSRDRAKGTVFRMKPDVTLVDLDPIWNPAGLPLARAVTEACPAAHVILIAPEGYAQGQSISTAAQESGWSVIIRRKGGTDEQLVKAIVAGLSGGSWIDPDLIEPDDGQATGDDEATAAGEKRKWEDDLADDALERASSIGTLKKGSVSDEETADWQERARKGIGT